MKNSIIDNVADSINIPLCVKLDGTFVSTRVVWEAVVAIMNKNPFMLLLVPFWFLRGKLFMEQKIFEASNNNYDVRLFPYRKRLVDFIKSQQEIGRKTILISNSYIGFSEKIFRYVKIFESIVAPDKSADINFDIKKKLLNNFGEFGFDYIGNSSEDLPIFESARLSYLVEPSATVLSQAKRHSNVETVFRSKKDKILIFFQSVHISRVVINLIIFVPLLFCGLSIENIINLLPTLLIALCILSLVSMSFRLIYDLSNLSYIRSHPHRLNCPVAIGTFGIHNSFAFSIIFLAIGIALSLTYFAPQANIAFILFLLLNFIYAQVSNKFIVVDIFLIALLLLFIILFGHIICLLELSIIQSICYVIGAIGAATICKLRHNIQNKQRYTSKKITIK